MKRHIIAGLACVWLGLSAAWAAGPQVELDTTMGKVKLELWPEAAPKTVDNFLTYVKAGFYDGTQFHRVIKGFMIQGGGFDDKMQQKPTREPVVNEGPDNQKAGVKNVIGTIAMARTNNPHSATAQFFINVANNGMLDYTSSTPQGYGYTVFGKVIEGMDVVNKIALVETGMQGGHGDVPKTTVLIKKAMVLGGDKVLDKATDKAVEGKAAGKAK